MTVRAKFVCEEKTETVSNGVSYRFDPVVSGSKENEEFFRYTPAGSLKMSVVNPKVVFDVGKAYYLDFTPVDEPAS